SLHARKMKGHVPIDPPGARRRYECKPTTVPAYGRTFEGCWALGSLAYVLSPQARKKLWEMRYDGLPMDLVLVNRFKTAILDPSLFQHDRQHGSLIDPPRK